MAEQMDRVHDVYSGRVYNDTPFQKKLKERVHWICKRAQGQNVLDVGCSQGTISILLGREGFHCLGLDIEPEAIAYATRELEAEGETVRNRVSFVCGEIDQISDQNYDTIVFSEVMEHLVHPETMLNRLWNLLKLDGRIIITVPFGIHDHADHKETYFLSNFFSVVTPYFEIIELEIVGVWLCCTLKKRENKLEDPPCLIPYEYVIKCDRAFNNIQEQLLDQVKRLKNKVELQKEQLQNEQLQNEQLQNEHIQKEQQDLLTKATNLQRELTVKQNQLVKIKKLQNDLITAARKWEKACNDRDKAIKWLGNRLAVTKQSAKFFFGEALVECLKKPWKTPAVVIKTIGYSLNEVKRKIKGDKRTYTIEKLPFEMAPKPLPAKVNKVDNMKQSGPTYSPEATTAAPEELKKLTIACIMDEFSYECFNPECNLIRFGPDNWLETLTIHRPDFLLVESAWRGNNLSWRYRIAKYDKPPGNELEELVDWCKNQGIPTVFWNKEDPVHFEKFIDTARLFDYVFTTDENCIPRYKSLLKHDNVHALPFAAQPVLHNPIKVLGERKNKTCFAGSYYATRHEDRRKDLEDLLSAAIPFGLEIYDRNYLANSPQFRFHDKFQPHIVGSLPYKELVPSYKRYRVFLNVNSVQDSPTMFSRRVYELLACGTPVVSTEALGTRQMFGDIVKMAANEDEFAAALEELFQSDEVCSSLSIKGIRRVFDQHLYAHRLHFLVEKIGFKIPEPFKSTISVVSHVQSVTEFDSVVQCYVNQTYPDKELVVAASPALQEALRSNPGSQYVKLIVPLEGDENSWVTEILENVEGDFVSVVNGGCHYGPSFLQDARHSFIYSGAEIVGKAAYFSINRNDAGTLILNNPEMEECYTARILPGTWVFRRPMLDEIIRFYGAITPDTTDKVSGAGYKVYSNNRFGFCQGTPCNEDLFSKIDV